MHYSILQNVLNCHKNMTIQKKNNNNLLSFDFEVKYFLGFIHPHNLCVYSLRDLILLVLKS